MKILLAMSGGIDSSASAVLLKEAGHDVTGVFMRHGVKHEAAARPGKQGCCSLDDAYDARRVADLLGVPFYVLNFEREFGRIIDYFVAEYDRGATPNPCIKCNKDLKFGKLFEYADAIGAEAVATGHYAQVRHGRRHVLARGVDSRKDQSYVLFPLDQAQLARCVFPVGGLEKPAVRDVARRAGLAVAEKAESQEICFVPSGDYRGIVKAKLGDRVKPGVFKTTSGDVVGSHEGHQLFTIGQRRGLGVALGRPMYVVAIEAETNTVVLGDDADLREGELIAEDVNWIAVDPAPGDRFESDVKIRYNHGGARARVDALEGGRARVVFDEAPRAITPGQAAVFYRGDEVLGGGWIS
jgi:tRNA-specific 2-thiouridylase